jgi:prepilin peptidase CpaA
LSWLNGEMNFALVLFLISVLVSAAIFDIRVQRIPNLLTYPTMAGALIYHSIANGGGGFLFAAEGLGLGIGLFLMPYLMGVMGAGDAKLMGAVGATLGAKGVFQAALITAVVGGIYALIVLLVRFRFLKGLVRRYALTVKTFLITGQLVVIPAAKDEPEPKLYYGAAIALGTLTFIFLELAGYHFLT